MIVRISTAGQFKLDDGCVDRLNALDNSAVEAVDSNASAVNVARSFIIRREPYGGCEAPTRPATPHLPYLVSRSF